MVPCNAIINPNMPRRCSRNLGPGTSRKIGGSSSTPIGPTVVASCGMIGGVGNYGAHPTRAHSIIATTYSSQLHET